MYVCMYSAPKANARERNCIVMQRPKQMRGRETVLHSAPKANARERDCIVFIVYENVCMYACIQRPKQMRGRETVLLCSAQSKCEGEKLYCIQRPKRAASTPRRQPSRSPANLLNSFLLTPKSLAMIESMIRLKGGLPRSHRQHAGTFQRGTTS